MREEPPGRIVWLASYPKSGNTWARVFLANYLSDAAEPVSINGIAVSTPEGALQSIASARQFFSDMLGIDAGDLSHDECDNLRPDVYRALSAEATVDRYIKIHDANVLAPSGEPLIPPEATRLAVYLVRNPLDVAVSFANHCCQPIAAAIDDMARPEYAFCSSVRGLPDQLRQRLLTWSGHVQSWVDHAAFPVHVMRYEDMLARPVETFGTLVKVLGLSADDRRLARALEFSRFDELRRQEDEQEFLEAPLNAQRFFLRGRAGAWREHLTDDQVYQAVTAHREVMVRFGYLDGDGQPCLPREEAGARS